MGRRRHVVTTEEWRARALLPKGRWSPSRKSCVVWAIVTGAITATEAMAAHGIAADELLEWCDVAVHRGPAFNGEQLVALRRLRESLVAAGQTAELV